MKNIMLFICLLTGVLTAQTLRVSDDGRRLVKEDGSAFIYLADTAWELFHRCNREEAELYLRDRRDKGFTVIQAVILAELDGLNTPNPYGERPLIDNDPLKPNEKYFEHVDWILRKAQELDLVIAALPTWGDKWNLRWGVGPVIFDASEKAEQYGEWLGRRYKEQANIIWVLGGDRIPEKPLHLEIIRAMARGLRQGDGGRHLMTFHPMGSKSSSEWFHHDDWLDFNMMQTGHWQRHKHVYKMIEHDYRLQPIKPCLDGEPQYEDIQVRLSPDNERFTAYDAREAAWWAMLAGACGHTYGNGNIWQMYKPGREPVLGARLPWDQAIDQPGARQMGFMRQVFESRPFLDLVPDQQVLSDYFGQDYDRIRAARDKSGSWLIVYLPQGQATRIRVQKLEADTVSGWWFNPREGTSQRIEPFANPKTDWAVMPPSSGPRTDWVLILDDATKEWPDPADFQW